MNIKTQEALWFLAIHKKQHFSSLHSKNKKKKLHKEIKVNMIQNSKTPQELQK
jgi:hypothetical protein